MVMFIMFMTCSCCCLLGWAWRARRREMVVLVAEEINVRGRMRGGIKVLIACKARGKACILRFGNRSGNGRA